MILSGGSCYGLWSNSVYDKTFYRSSASEINRYSPNQEAPNDSEQEATSISPTTGHVRPGKRRRRSDKDNIPAGIRKLPSPPTTLEQAQMEWDLVETVQPGMLTKYMYNVQCTYTCAVESSPIYG